MYFPLSELHGWDKGFAEGDLFRGSLVYIRLTEAQPV